MKIETHNIVLLIDSLRYTVQRNVFSKQVKLQIWHHSYIYLVMKITDSNTFCSCSHILIIFTQWELFEHLTFHRHLRAKIKSLLLHTMEYSNNWMQCASLSPLLYYMFQCSILVINITSICTVNNNQKQESTANVRFTATLS